MPRVSAIVVGGAALALGLAVSLALARVITLESGELEASSEPRALASLPGGAASAGAGSARLLEVRLVRGDEVRFELCAEDAMEAARWQGAAEVAVVRTDRAEEMFAVPIDERMLASAARDGSRACVTFARVASLALDEPSVPAAIELAWDAPPRAILDVPLRARVLARRPLGGVDLAIVFVALACALGLVAALASRRPREVDDGGRWGAARAALALVLVLAGGVALGWLGPGGPTAGLVSGLALAAIEIGVALALVRPAQAGARLAALGVERPAGGARAIAAFVSAPIAGVLLFVIARLLLASVRSTGRAPIEELVSWPSGMLGFAALAVVAPIAEEVFFRGLVYGALRGEGGGAREALAIPGAWIFFALFHLPQDWGNWGGLASVLVAGLGFTLLRAGSRSTLVPCVAHLVYNGLLAAGAVAAGAS